MSLYKSMYQRCWFPFFEGVVKGRDTAKIYRELQKTQWLPQEELLRLQGASLRRLLTHAESRSTFYRERFREAGLVPAQIRSPEDLRSLPLLTKCDIRSNYGDLVCEDKNRVWAKATGGSTGEPLRFGYTMESYAWRVAASKRGYSWAAAQPGSKQAYIWGGNLGPVTPLTKLKEKLHHFLDRHLYFNCFEFDEAEMIRCAARLNRFQPDTLIGYSTPLYTLAKFLEGRKGIEFVPKGIITAAEKVLPYQREVIERVFKAPVFNSYGSREFMLIASECDNHQGLHQSAENLIVEIVKDDGSNAADGEVGRIVITDLHNYGMPFIRYEIGDLAVATSRICSCGRSLPLIADVIGRTLDVIRTPDGKVVPGEFFPHLLKDYPEIKRFQVVQKALDRLMIKIVPEVISATTTEAIKKMVTNQMGQSIHVDYEFVSEIPLTATGKHRVTISELPGENND